MDNFTESARDVGGFARNEDARADHSHEHVLMSQPAWVDVLVVDGLDECNNTTKQCQLLDILLFIVKCVPFPVSIIIASRPEHHIRNAFYSEGLNQCSHSLSLDASYRPDDDIRKFLQDAFKAERQKRSDFPSDKVWSSLKPIDVFVTQASGQFIYASTVVKFICSPRHNFMERLNIVMGAIEAGSQRPFEQLDLLYEVIFNGIHADNVIGALRVLGLLLLPGLELPPRNREWNQTTNTHSPSYIENFLGLRLGDVRHFLYDLESLLTIRGDDENIQIFHASLSDYLFDFSRSGQFWIDHKTVYADILKPCLSRVLSWYDLGESTYGRLTNFVDLNRFW